jgi:hypothetical protein
MDIEKTMKRTQIIRKCLVVGIILLFVGIIVTPSINANNPETSLDDDLVVVLQTDKFNYQMGESVEISIYVENHGNTNITVVFPTTQKADFLVSESYLWSGGKVFLTMLTPVTIPSGTRVCLLNDSWEQVDFSGNQVPPRSYEITGWMVQSMEYPPIYAQPINIRIGSKIEIGVHGGIGVIISMTNVGLINTTGVKGNVSIKGGIFGLINLSESFDVDSLVVNESISKTFHPVGFGPIKIDIIVSASNAEELNLEGRMSVIFFLVYPIIPPYENIEVNQ